MGLKLLDRARLQARAKKYGLHTERSYVNWIKRFILFHNKRHPESMGRQELESFLTHLAVREEIAASTQNQALSALLLLYREVLETEQGWVNNIAPAKNRKKIPAVFSREEVRKVPGCLSDPEKWLMASLLYGSGLRLTECLRLRVKDADFERCEIIVREGKGGKERRTMFPEKLLEPLRVQIEKASAGRISEASSAKIAVPDMVADGASLIRPRRAFSVSHSD